MTASARPTAADLGLVPATPGAYTVETVLWRADRFGNRLAPVATTSPITGSIAYNGDATDVRYLCSLTVIGPEAFEPWVDWIIPEITITDPSGTSLTRQRGHYLVLPPRRTVSPAKVVETIEAKDLSYVAQRSPIGSVRFLAGEDTGALARLVLLDAGLSERQVQVPNTGIFLTEDIMPPPGQPRLKVAGDLLESSAWYVPTMDPTTLALTSGPYIDYENTSATRTYSTSEGLRILPTIEEEADTSSTRNHVVVQNISTDPEVPTIWAEARILNRHHPLYHDPDDPDTVLEMSETFDDTTVPDKATAQARANYLLSVGASYYRKLRVRTVLDIEAGSHDVVALDLPGAGGPMYPGLWIRNGWRHDLKGVVATMDSDLSRTERLSDG